MDYILENIQNVVFTFSSVQSVVTVITWDIFILYFQARPLLLSEGGSTQATIQQLGAQTPAPQSPKVEEPQPGVPQILPPTHYYTWSPLGGSPMIIPVQQSAHGSQTFPQQPLVGKRKSKGTQIHTK